eukprot:s3053_g4.t1
MQEQDVWIPLALFDEARFCLQSQTATPDSADPGSRMHLLCTCNSVEDHVYNKRSETSTLPGNSVLFAKASSSPMNRIRNRDVVIACDCYCK